MNKLVKGLLIGALMLALTACGGKKDEVKVDLGTLIDEVVAEHFAEAALIDYDEDYLTNMMQMDTTLLESYVGKFPMIAAAPVDIGMFEAKEGNVEAVQKEVENYKQVKIDNAWYPMIVDAAENAVILTKGNYVFFIMCENTAEVQAQIEAAFTK